MHYYPDELPRSTAKMPCVVSHRAPEKGKAHVGYVPLDSVAYDPRNAFIEKVKKETMETKGPAPRDDSIFFEQNLSMRLEK